MPGRHRASSGRAGGKATKNPKQYRALKRKGLSEASAARITNAGKKELRRRAAAPRSAQAWCRRTGSE